MTRLEDDRARYPGFELYERPAKGADLRGRAPGPPRVTLGGRGVLRLSVAAASLLGDATHVTILVNREEKLVALRPEKEKGPYRSKLVRRPGTVVFSAVALVRELGLSFGRAYEVEERDGHAVFSYA